MNFLRRHRSKLLTALAVAAPIVAGIVSGGMLTAPVIITALGVFFAKLAASPLSHEAEREADVQRRLERIARREDS